MCGPLVLPIAGLVVAAAGTGLSVHGQAKAASANNATALANAQLANASAEDTIRRGAEAAGLTRGKGSQLQGHQRAAFGASGVDVASGTPEALVSSTAGLAELDAQTIKNNAAREAWGIRTQASNMATNAGAQADAARWGMAGSLLSGVGSLAKQGWDAYGDYKDWKRGRPDQVLTRPTRG